MNTAGLAKSLVLLALLLVGTVAGTFAIGASLDDADRTVTREDSLVVDYDATYQLETRGSFVSITAEVDGTALQRGTDYTFDESAGELSFADTTATTEGDVATVSWTYQGRSEAASTTRGLQITLIELLPYLALIPVGLFVLTLAAGVAAFSRRGGFSGGMQR